MESVKRAPGREPPRGAPPVRPVGGRGGRDGLDGRRLDDGRRLLPSVLTIAAVVVAAVPTVLLWDEPARSTFCIEEPLQGPQLCSFATDRFTLVFWGIVLFGTAVVALIGTAATRDGRIPQGEWHFLLLCSATGAMSSKWNPEAGRLAFHHAP